jgi:predicted ATP-dependent endonuclease of OLD family
MGRRAIFIVKTDHSMIVSKIRISHFRSILKGEIDFSSFKCLGLIGLNESGKSNVLHASRLLNKGTKKTSNDKCKISGKYPEIEFHLNLVGNDFGHIEAFARDILKKEVFFDKEILHGPITVTNIKKLVSANDDSVEYAHTYDLDLEFSLHNELSIMSPRTDESFGDTDTMQYKGATIQLSGVKFIDGKLIPDEQMDKFEGFDKSALLKLVKQNLYGVLDALCPTAIYWEYDAKYLLPSEISYDDLMVDDTPYENSQPLYNIFLLSKPLQINDVTSLKSKIELWKQDSSERKKDSRFISHSLNQYVKGIWADYDQDLNVDFESDKITIHINDPKSDQNNYYAMEARSQGFKTFISFILTIAADVENDISSNLLLLLDEPETHLHPSGARYMREELFKLSLKSNSIIYATHSIFMVDRNNLQRHVIVTKENELTRLDRVEQNNLIQEAVVFHSMGTEVDEFAIGPKNIIVEGILDLKLLDFFIKKCLDERTHKEIQAYRIWNGGGCGKIEKFLQAKLLPYDSIWYIIHDNDNPGQKLNKLVADKYQDGNFKITCSPYSQTPDFEIEDILPKSFAEQALNRALAALAITPKSALNFGQNSKTVSGITAEFKSKETLTKEASSLLEVTFKHEYEVLIASEVSKIDLLKNKEEKLKAFKGIFGGYFEFANDFVMQFVKDTTSKS